jgi:ubiquinone/menaquinone biosynthesis C-methylase UbiE
MVRPGGHVLELGCGYGRILPPLVARAARVFGIDTSSASLSMGRELMRNEPRMSLVCADAVRLPFTGRSFDQVVCIQNGISAFHVDRRELVRESLRVVRPGGMALFSSYAAKFWADRLAWFQLQAEHRLVGEIDYDKTRNGMIVCKDGFTATTVGPEEFQSLADELGVAAVIEEVDDSSVFCIFRR